MADTYLNDDEDEGLQLPRKVRYYDDEPEAWAPRLTFAHERALSTPQQEVVDATEQQQDRVGLFARPDMDPSMPGPRATTPGAIGQYLIDRLPAHAARAESAARERAGWNDRGEREVPPWHRSAFELPPEVAAKERPKPTDLLDELRSLGAKDDDTPRWVWEERPVAPRPAEHWSVKQTREAAEKPSASWQADIEEATARLKEQNQARAKVVWGDEPQGVIEKVVGTSRPTDEDQAAWIVAERKKSEDKLAFLEETKAKPSAQAILGKVGYGKGVLGTVDADIEKTKQRLKSLDKIEKGEAIPPQQGETLAFGQATIRGTTATVASILHGVGSGQGWIKKAGGSASPPEDTLVYKLGDWVEEKGKALFPEDPARRYEFKQKLGNGIGSSVVFYGPGILGKILGASDATLLGVIATSGGFAEAGSLFEEATEARDKHGRDISDTQRFLGWAGGFALGTTEAVPVAHMFQRVGAPAAGVREVGRRAYAYGGAVHAQAFEEAFQEGGQRVGENFLARELGIDPDRDIADDVAENMAVGYATGGLMQSAHLAASRQMREEARTPSDAQSQQPAAGETTIEKRPAAPKAGERREPFFEKPAAGAAPEGAPAYDVMQFYPPAEAGGVHPFASPEETLARYGALGLKRAVQTAPSKQIADELSDLAHALDEGAPGKRLSPAAAAHLAVGTGIEPGAPVSQPPVGATLPDVIIGVQEALGLMPLDKVRDPERALTSIGVIAEEGGPMIETLIGRPLVDLIEQHAAELGSLTSATGSDYLRDGFAKWFRTYVLDPELAQRQAEHFHEAFELMLGEERPDLLGGLERLQLKVLSKGYQDRAPNLELASIKSWIGDSAYAAVKAVEAASDKARARILTYRYPRESAVLGEKGPHSVGGPRMRFAGKLAEQEGVGSWEDTYIADFSDEGSAAESEEDYAAAAANDARAPLAVIDPNAPTPWNTTVEKAGRTPSAARDMLLQEIFEHPVTDTNRAYFEANALRLLEKWAREARTPLEQDRFYELAKRFRAVQ
jgi:hypothetical protein